MRPVTHFTPFRNSWLRSHENYFCTNIDCFDTKDQLTWHAQIMPWCRHYSCTSEQQAVLEDVYAWWRHQMETFSALLAICAGNSQRPVMRGFDVVFDLRLIKRLSKHSWVWWFETTLRPLWRHGNETYKPLIDPRPRIPVKLCMGLHECIHFFVESVTSKAASYQTEVGFDAAEGVSPAFGICRDPRCITMTS